MHLHVNKLLMTTCSLTNVCDWDFGGKYINFLGEVTLGDSKMTM